MGWNDEQEFERGWWGDCTNTYAEEQKQLTYTYKVGIQAGFSNGHWPSYNIKDKSIMDIGGGPVSILLKCENRGSCCVIDPCDYPAWVKARYDIARIDYIKIKGEDLAADFPKFDEVWIYNVLQHTEDPELIIQNAKSIAPIIRIFEWVDMPAHEGHPHELTEKALNKWLNGTGTVEFLDENWCHGKSYYGVFER